MHFGPDPADSSGGGPLRIQQPPEKPVLLFDAECQFCCYWIRRWQRITKRTITYIPLQDPSVAEQFPELPRSRLEQAVHLIDSAGGVSHGAEAVFRSLGFNPRWGWPLALYQSLPGVAPVSEAAYRLVARHRTAFSWLTRMLWGVDTDPPSYRLVLELFLRGLGLIYFLAFFSLWLQVSGLFGSQGILPVAQYMAAARQYFDQHGPAFSRYHLLPTLFWFGASNGALHCLCAAGVAVSGLLVLGLAPLACTSLLWILYLSLVTVGRDFLGFQWDALLLESGFIALLLAPARWGWKSDGNAPMTSIGIGLLRWLVFRLMFESGCVKLLSGDTTWRQLMALRYHYETQPLPPWPAWYAHHWPTKFQQACVVLLFVVELGLPFLIFAPRRLRFAAAAGFVVLQVGILVTGNYGFFNYLTILLCLPLLDDGVLRRCASAFGLERNRPGSCPELEPGPSSDRSRRFASVLLTAWRRWIAPALALVMAVVSLAQVCAMFGWRSVGGGIIVATANWLAPFRSVNSYGLFAVMTVSRPEIIIEGSNDARNWYAYEFKYKPGDLHRRPKFVAPYQPRLDWQMWFAALGSYPQNPWFVPFCFRLLQGSPAVVSLLERNPFPKAPPKFIRAVLYNYRFTDRATKDKQAWWVRERVALYLPPVSLETVIQGFPAPP
jgi:predicted DCC family thiol-disulfide oxidoreductase YuxK